MSRRLAILVCVPLALVLLWASCWAGENARASVFLNAVQASDDTWTYEVLFGDTHNVGVAHVEITYDSNELEFLDWENAAFIDDEMNLRIGPRLEGGPGVVLVAIYSPRLVDRTSFELGRARFLRQTGSDAIPTILRAAVADRYHVEDSVVTPGGGLAPPAPAASEVLPVRFGLQHVGPNPLARATTVAFEVPRAGSQVAIRIYDVTGRVARTLLDAYRPPGYYSETWDLRNDHGQRVAPGIYFCRMEAGEFTDTKKMALVR